MAYVNPYANTMEYKPRTLWNQPERPRTDWSTFWGTPEEDDDGTDNGDENGYNPEGPKSQVEAGAGSELKSLWGDVVKDMKEGYKLGQSENMFDNLFGPGITAVTPANTVPNTTDYVNGWQNPDYTGPQLDTDFITDVSLPANYNAANNTQNAGVTVSALANAPNITSTAVQPYTNAYSPSYGTQADVYAEYPELSGNLGLLQDTSQISLADQLTNNQAAIDQNALQRITLAEELANNQVEIDRNARELGIFDTMQDVYSDPNLSEEDILW